MACYKQGYDEERFESRINQNFLCLICFNVLREPVLCPRNQHIFCRGCITKHLENFKRCPTCADPLTVETLTEPNRIVKDYLDELTIHCEYVNRGCQETVQLQHLDRHEATCGFQPVVCTNQGCGVTVSRRDLVHHESELCEFRKLKCHSCGEMSKTLEGMEKKMTNMERNMAVMETNILNVKTNMTSMEENVSNVGTNVANVETTVKNIETDIKDMKANMEINVKSMEMRMTENNTKMEAKMEANLQAVNNEVRELKETLTVKMEDMKEEITREVRLSTASGEKKMENIIVAGGAGTTSVEMFNWRQKLWSPLQSMPETRWGATSFVYNNHVTISGGWCFSSGHFDDMIRMNINPNPDLAIHWSECPVKLPAKLRNHSSVPYSDQLLVTGGYNGNIKATSDRIDEVQLVPPYAAKTLSRMPEPRREHSTQIFDENLLIVGGAKTDRCRDTLKSVVLYDIKKNECKQLSPLPYEVSGMATVRWGDNIVVIGGRDKRGNGLDTVIMYNVKTEQSHMLPPMRCKRRGCVAVVVENNIVVLGGSDEQEKLKSVEAFNFDSYTWEELPEMSEERWRHTAAVV